MYAPIIGAWTGGRALYYAAHHNSALAADSWGLKKVFPTDESLWVTQHPSL